MMREMTERLGARPRARGRVPAARTRRTSPRASGTAVRAGDRRGLAPAGCRTGSSACTCWSRTRSPPGPGVNPLGDEALALLPPWWADGPCVEPARAGRRRDGLTTTRVAAIDCGTNSIRLLVADVDPAGGHARSTLDRSMQIVRLGEGVDRTGRLSDAALARTFAACDAYAARIARARRRAGALRRDVGVPGRRQRRRRSSTGVRERLGRRPAEVVAGDEEAELSFAGATRELAGREPGAVPRRRHRRRLDRVRARRRRARSRRARSTSAASA